MPDGTNTIPQKRISELPPATAANDSDQLEANQSGTSRNLTLAQVKAGVWSNAQLTGLPTAPTAASTDRSKAVATTEFVGAVAVASAPQAGDGTAISGTSTVNLLDTSPVGRGAELLKIAYGVANLAAVANLFARPPTVVLQDGTGSFYWAAGSAASADGYMVVNPTSGPPGRYIRIWDHKILQSIWFGAVENGTTDDTPAWTRAAAFNSTLAKPVPFQFVGTTVLQGPININNLPIIDGLNTGTILAKPGWPSGSQSILQYTGTGDVWLRNFKATLPITIQATQPTSGGGGLVMTLPAAGSSVGSFRAENVTVVGGGQYGFDLHATSNIYIDHCTFDRCWSAAIDLACTQDSYTNRSQNISIMNTHARGIGVIAMSLPNNGAGQSQLHHGTRHIRIENCTVEGSGWNSGQGQIAIVGTSQTQVLVDATFLNCMGNGCVTMKRNKDWGVVTGYCRPSLHAAQMFKVRAFTQNEPNYILNLSRDNQSGMSGNTDSPTEYDPAGNRDILVDVDYTYASPPFGFDGGYYDVGDVIMAPTAASSGYSYYLCLQPGTTGTGTRPNGRTQATPYVDGTVTWVWFGDVSAINNYAAGATWNAQTLGVNGLTTLLNLSGEVRGVAASLKAQGTGDFAVLGSSVRAATGEVMQDITLTMKGTCNGPALQDQVSAIGGGVNLTVDRLVLSDCAVRSTGLYGSPGGLILIGQQSLPATATYTNMVIDGGHWRSEGTNQAWLSTLQASSNISCKITGAPNVYAKGYALQIRGTVNIRWAGGGLIEIANSSDTAISGSINATGSIEIGEPVRLITDAAPGTANFRGWKALGNGTNGPILNPNVRFDRGYSAAAPTSTAGNLGDFFRSITPVAGNCTGWMCTTTSGSAATWTAF